MEYAFFIVLVVVIYGTRVITDSGWMASKGELRNGHAV